MAAPPRAVGKYRLYDRIGSGGMGSVHLARLFASGGFRRIVAIKRLHPHFAEDAAFVTAFLDEARLASRIHHPNVVAPLDVVGTDGEVFLVFEHVLGVSLSVLLRRVAADGASIPQRVAVSIMTDVLHGLHAAHEATGDDGALLGLIHRDVSPQNILVGKDGSARLLDFGIAKAAGRSQTTGEGIIKGKRGYMAPEHLLGQTCRGSDVYSAAVVLWEMIAQQRLFPDDDSVVGRLSGRAVASPFAGVPTHAWPDHTMLASIVLRGVAHEPSQRFATAREMAIALEPLGIATAREVGEWVESVGRVELQERAHLVSSVESAPSEASMGDVSSTMPLDGDTRDARDSAASVMHVELTASESASPRKSGAWRRAAAVPVLALLAIFVWLLLRRPTVTTAAAPVSESVASATVPPSIEPVPALAAIPPVATSSAVVRVRPHAKRATPCAPYIIDSHGRKQFNEACLR